nr:hypothetical protein CFP56_40721 [Quercus suber]
MEESTGAVSSVALDNRDLTQAHRYVLFNSENIHQFREMHIRLMEDELSRGRGRISNDTIHKHYMEKFCSWFRCHDDTDAFLENIPYSLPNTDVGTDDLRWGRDDVEGMTIDASIIGPRDLHEMDNLDECEFIDDESNDEDANDVEYSDEE